MTFGKDSRVELSKHRTERGVYVISVNHDGVYKDIEIPYSTLLNLHEVINKEVMEMRPQHL